ncbi:hypothetical protein LSCM1_01213 [Leishmania martiniquensis]|uniref:Uncharacterized protein n=1 Tax=Leishmania martiniquensis TaxID=1580590 RepID=A0A836KIM5_9TRYP|nr:hypothetical protein LSCM1_01213 [Leishmania martiniquensis]
MSDSVASAIGAAQRNFSPLLSPSRDPSLHRRGSSFSASDGYGDQGRRRRVSVAQAETPAQFFASGHSLLSCSAAEVPQLSPAARASAYWYAMDAPNDRRNASGTSLDSAELEDSEKYSYHPIKLMMGSGGDVGSPTSAHFVNRQSTSNYLCTANVGSSTLALSAKNSLASPRERTQPTAAVQPIIHTVKPFEAVSAAGAQGPMLADGTPLVPLPASKSSASSDSLRSLRSADAPLPIQQLAETRAETSARVGPVDATAAVPPIVALDANTSCLATSALDLPSLPPQSTPQPLTSSNITRQMHKLSTSFSNTPQGVNRLPLAPVSRSSASPACGSRDNSEGDARGLRSDKPQAIPLARKARETPLALLASSSSSGNGASGGSEVRGRDGPAKLNPSLSTSSPRESSDDRHATPGPPASLFPVPEAPPQGQPLLFSPSAATPVATPPIPGAASAVNFMLAQPKQLAVADLVRFSPIIQQFNFRKTDIKKIACTGIFTMGDVSTVTVRLRLLSHDMLGRAEPILNVQQAALRAGRVKALKPKTSVKRRASAPGIPPADVAPEPPRVVDVADFHDTLAVFDNALLAISFALWGSVAPYNDLVMALLAFCAPDLRPRSKGHSRREPDSDGVTGAGEQEANALVAAAAPASARAAPKKRIRVPFSSVLRFLNRCGIDVLVISSDQKCASSFCAKRRHVLQGGRPPSADVACTTQTASEMDEGGACGAAASEKPLRRVLVALSYDHEEGLWCPLTTSRPLRQVASQWSAYCRSQRRQTRSNAKREKSKADAEAAAKAEKAAIEAQLLAWQQRIASNGPGPHQSEPGGTDTDAASFRLLTAATNGDPQVGIAFPGDISRDGSRSPPVKPGNRLPFDTVLYPNLMQTNWGFTLLLREGLHPLFTMVRARLIFGVPLGCAVVLFGIALVVYVSKSTAVCLIDLHTGQCVDVSSSGNSGSSSSSRDDGCLALLTSLLPSARHTTLSNRYLYGPSAAPGTCLIVTICCNFVALLDSVLLVFFAVRYLALGSIHPCFIYVLRGVHAVLGAIVCAFAAYVVFVVHKRLNVLPCSTLAAGDAILCASRLENCGHRYAYGVHGPLMGTNVALVLSCVYLALCALHWLVAALPVLPNVDTQDLIPTATPDTYAFHPSLFAPDGPIPPEVGQLRHAMQPPLRQELSHYSQARERLLTTMATIGEMMQANRVNSLKQTELNEERRQQRARPFQERSRGDADGRRGPKGRRRRHQRYVVVPAEEQTASCCRPSSLQSSDSGARYYHNSIVLAPRLVKRVAEIGSRLQECSLRAAALKSFGSANASLSEMPGAKLAAPSPVPQVPRRLAGSRRSSLPCTLAPGARGGGVTDDESVILNSGGDDPTRRLPAMPLTAITVIPDYTAATAHASPPLHAPLSTQSLASLDLVTFPNSMSPVAATSGEQHRHSGESQCSRFTSARSAENTCAVSPSVDAEIDQIVARLRARKAAALDGAQ